MKIAIVGAMDEEISLLREQLAELKQREVEGYQFYIGKIANKDIIVLKSGIGKVSAAIGIALLKFYFQPDYIINTGSAGRLSPDLKVGAIVISSSITYHDVDVTAFNYEMGQVPCMPARFVPDDYLRKQAVLAASTLADVVTIEGLIVSGDSFVNTSQQVAIIRKYFPEGYALEMEAGAIAQTCYLLKIPYLIIRAISDMANEEAKMTHEEFLQLAANNSARLVISLVQKI